MQALVKTAPGPGHMELMDVTEPLLGPNQVKIRVEAAGICGTDIHVRHGLWFSLSVPVILGHEFSGVIQEVGPGVEGWEVGDRVTSEPPVDTCGACEYCQMGLPALCPERKSLGTWLDGAFAEFVATPTHRLHRLPEHVDFRCGAVAEPAACCVHAVIEQARVSAGDVVVVTGPGPMGLLTAQLAKAHGATVILTGTGQDDERLGLARELGVNATVNVEADSIADQVRVLSAGRGADMAFECAGTAAAARTCLEVVRKRGQYVQIGVFTQSINVDLSLVVTKELTVNGSFGSTYTSWERALKLMDEGKLSIAPLITNELPLEQWEEAFDEAENKRGCKVLLRPTLD